MRLKKEIGDRTDSVIPLSFVSNEKAKDLTLNDLEERTFYVMKDECNGKKLYAKININYNIINFEEWGEEVDPGSCYVDFFHFINSKKSVIDTNKFLKEHKEELHNQKHRRIDLKALHWKSIKEGFASFAAKLLKEFKSLLNTLGCSVVPKEAFLKIDRASEEREVIVTTDGESPRAINFLLLASGIMDDSYEGTSFDCNASFAKGGDYFPAVVDGIQDGEIYEEKEPKRGDVDHPDGLSLFFVLKEDSSIKSGKEVQELRSVDLVSKCALLFDLNESSRPQSSYPTTVTL